MQILELDTLLGLVYPEATFHDSELEALDVNLTTQQATLRFRIQIGEDQTREGILNFTGLLFFEMDRPSSKCPLWITADGPFPDSKIQTNIVPPSDLPDEAFCHYFFASNANTFMVLAATHARFTWTT